ncbi:hypothetical protein JOQ06_000799, partial [Pogonophryne albipinna]
MTRCIRPTRRRSYSKMCPSIEDALEAFRDRLLIVIASSSSSQLSLNLGARVLDGIQTGPQTVPAADRSLPSSAGMGLEIDLIRIQKYAFDLT